MGMKVRGALLDNNRVKVFTSEGVKYLMIGKDIIMPYAFIYPEYADKIYGDAFIIDTDLKHHLTKRKVVKYECLYPNKIIEIRDRLGYDETFEADIPYLRRLFVDGILEVDYSNGGVVFIDIETDDSKGFPKPDVSEIVSIAYSFMGSDKIEWLYIGDYTGEGEMLREFKNILLSKGANVIVGWNVKFDKEFLSIRGGLGFLDDIDMLSLYKAEVKGLESYSLENVARIEGIGTKIRNKRIVDMNRQELMEYNMNDVALMLELEKKYGLIGLRIRIAELVNLPINMLSPVRIGDTLILRRARELGYVLSNSIRSQKRNYQGAFVFEPKMRGLVRKVAVFDFESLYPNIIINERIDIPGFNGEVLPYIEERLLKLRKEAKNKLKETGDMKYDIEQKAYKILANSLYGLFGTEGFRFMDLNKASFITGKGREMLMKASELVNDMGYEIIYGDTDSIFISGWNTQDDLILLEVILNERLKPYRMKLEYFGDIYMMAKKRYIFRKMNGEMIYKGVEVVRGDWAKLYKEVVERIISMLFMGESLEKIREYLNQIRIDLISGKLDDKLIICKSYNADKKYKVVAEHVKAAEKMIKKYKIPEDTITEVCYVYVSYGDGVEPVINGMIPNKLDYRRYWERLMTLVNRIIIGRQFGLK